MPGLLLWGLVFVVTLAGLIFSANIFIKAAERVGLALGIPAFIIGITLVAMGTSLPELVTSIVAVLAGAEASAIVPGNVIGSNITNMGLILGILGVVGKKIDMQFEVGKVDLPMFLGSALLLWLCLMDGDLSLVDGLLCLGGLGVYLAYVFALGKENNTSTGSAGETPAPRMRWSDPLLLLLSAIAIYFTAEYNVRAVTELATLLHVGTDLIALTVVALGTSLPELVVSILALRSGKSDMAIGNLLGSNIFNIFAVIGIPRLFGEIVVPASIMSNGLPSMLAITLLGVLIFLDRHLNRWEGWLLLLLYAIFLINLG
ncbi:MAG: calcium/sodium antiporter [Bacteroidia bacterium]